MVCARVCIEGSVTDLSQIRLTGKRLMRMLKRHSRRDVTTSKIYVNEDYHPRYQTCLSRHGDGTQCKGIIIANKIY